MSDDRGIAIERIQHMIEAADIVASEVDRGRAEFDADHVELPCRT